MKNGVLRPGHIQLRVLDIQAALNFYTNVLGLRHMGTDPQGRIYLKGWTEVDKYSVVLRESDTPGMDFMGFKVIDEDALNMLEQKLIKAGIAIEHKEKGELQDCGQRLQFVAPSGHRFELYFEKAYTGKWGIEDTDPEAWPRGLKGMKATRFDHCLLYGNNIDETAELFVNVLGFFVSEQVATPEGEKLAQFLSLSTKAHDIAFIKSEEAGKLHHVSFLLDSWEEILRASDLLSMTNTPLDIGPTRHGLTHGKTVYFFDPSGNRCEVFAGGDYSYPDHKPVTWSAQNIGKAIFYHEQEVSERFRTAVT